MPTRRIDVIQRKTTHSTGTVQNINDRNESTDDHNIVANTLSIHYSVEFHCIMSTFTNIYVGHLGKFSGSFNRPYYQVCFMLKK